MTTHLTENPQEVKNAACYRRQVKKLGEDNQLLWKMIRDAQNASNSCGLIGEIGSMAWIGQVKKLKEELRLLKPDAARTVVTDGIRYD